MEHHSRFLERFIHENNIKVFAEIGVFRCRLLKYLHSTCSSLVDEYWAIDPWAPLGNKEHGGYVKFSTKDWHNLYLSACKIMSSWPSLHVVRLSSRDVSRLFDKPHFDLVYIDALHTYEACLYDINAWLPKVKKNGFIGGHDYAPEKGVFRAVNESFSQERIKTGSNMAWYVQI